MPGSETAGEVVMTVEVQVAIDLNEPGATAGTTRHTARNGDHISASMLPDCASCTLAGLSGLAIERRGSGVAMGVESLIGRLIIGPANTSNHIGQEALIIRSNDYHTKVMMIIIWPGIYPV